MEHKVLGQILLERKLIGQAQLDEALALQKQLTPPEPIGRILVRLGHLREAELQQILDGYGKRQRLVDILVEQRLVSREDLEIAIEMSRSEKLPLERVLLNLDFLSEEELARAIAIQHDRPFVHLDNRAAPVKTGLALGIIAASPPQHRMVPVALDGRALTIAMNRPLSVNDLKRLEEMIKLKVETVIAPESEIVAAQTRFSILPGSGNIEEVGLDIGDDLTEIISAAADEPEVEREARTVTEQDSLLVKLVNKIVCDAHARRASDIHIEPYPGKSDIVVRTRVDGCCEIYQRLPYKYKYAIPSRIKIMADLDIAERRRPQDGKIDFKKFGPLDLELRVATMPTVGNLEDVVLRLLHAGKPLPFAQLGLSEENRRRFEESILKPHGLILVVGPTGSGKTTTLHSAIARINTPKVKIWTAEDPVEIVQEGLRQVQVNPKIGLTFAAALRSFLRLDPDVVMVGEMRDHETAAIAVEASLTGHLVLSTLHTNSAIETVLRLLDLGLDPFAFSDSLLCVLAQRLARRLCEKCREPYRPAAAELADLAAEYGVAAFDSRQLPAGPVTLSRAKGCEHCLNSGYRGRLAIHELLTVDDGLRTLIRRKAPSEELRRLAAEAGMTTLRQDGIRKVLHGLTDIGEIRRVCLR